MTSDQEDAYKERFRDPDERAGLIDSLGSLALVNKELRELAAKHQFNYLSSGKASQLIFRFAILPRYGLYITEVHFLGHDETQLDNAQRLTGHPYWISVALIRRFPNLKMLLLEDVGDAENEEEIKSLMGAIATLHHLKHLAVDLSGDALMEGWTREAFGPLASDPPPLQTLQLVWFALDHDIIDLISIFGSTIETLCLELWSPEPEPDLSSRDPIRLPHLTCLDLNLSPSVAVFQEVIRILSPGPHLSSLSYNSSNSGLLDPTMPTLVAALGAHPALLRVQLGELVVKRPLAKFPPTEDLASPSSLAAYAHLVHSRNLDASVLDRPHLTPFHTEANLDYTENEGAYLVEVLDRTLDFGRTELKRMVAEGRAASAVAWVAALKPLEDKRLAWKD
ncbi:hypothetical protein RQP46_002563 [Phenoliferia psychrophenolica]